MTAQTELELSRPVETEGLRDIEHAVRFDVSDHERLALAQRFGIDALEGLGAAVALSREKGGRVNVSGSVEARLRQICAVSSDPFSHELSFRFERQFAASIESLASGDLEFDPVADDPPDDIVDGVIDIGEVVAEELALRIDPFARRPGAVFELPENGEDTLDGPFAALKRLKSEAK